MTAESAKSLFDLKAELPGGKEYAFADQKGKAKAFLVRALPIRKHDAHRSCERETGS